MALAVNGWWHRRRERLDGISDLLQHAEGCSVLDLGCHRGLVGYEFARHGATLVHGCDTNETTIATARVIFSDTLFCESQFEVSDLAKGSAALSAFGAQRYDIVLLLGVYHKIKRVMKPDDLSKLIIDVGGRAKKWFAWNGYPEEFHVLAVELGMCGMNVLQRNTVMGQHTAIWQRYD